MAIASPCLSILTLNENGLTTPIKRQRLNRLKKEKDTTICCPSEAHFSFKHIDRMKVKGWKRYFVNSSRRYNNYKYLSTQYHSTEIYKVNINRSKGRNRKTIMLGDFNTPLSK